MKLRYSASHSGADTIGNGRGGHVPFTFTNGWARGAPWVEQKTRNWPNCRLLPITKALTTTTNCTLYSQKVEGHEKKISGAHATPLLNLFVPAQLASHCHLFAVWKPPLVLNLIRPDANSDDSKITYTISRPMFCYSLDVSGSVSCWSGTLHVDRMHRSSVLEVSSSLFITCSNRICVSICLRYWYCSVTIQFSTHVYSKSFTATFI